MNSQLSIFNRSGFGRISRSQLSPLLRRSLRAILARSEPRRLSALSSGTGAAGPQSSPSWQRGLLDRLQPELTRFHD